MKAKDLLEKKAKKCKDFLFGIEDIQNNENAKKEINKLTSNVTILYLFIKNNLLPYEENLDLAIDQMTNLLGICKDNFTEEEKETFKQYLHCFLFIVKKCIEK